MWNRELPRRATKPLLVFGLAVLVSFSGCASGGGGSGSSGGSGGGSTDFVSSSGNWQLSGVPSAGSSPITMSGVISEQSGAASSHFTTAALQVTSACYLDSQIVPLDGQVTEKRLQIASFDVKKQYLSLDAQKNSDATQLTGTYTISGGCGDGQSGSLTGQRYSTFTGTYSGSIPGSTSRLLTLTVTQEIEGTGEGTFLLSGSAHMDGFSCFNAAQTASSGDFVSGSGVNIRLTTNDAFGAQVVLKGTINPSAQTFTVTSAHVEGGSCSGDLGQLVLNRQ